MTPLTEKIFNVPEIIGPRLERVPMRRLGTVDEIANGRSTCAYLMTSTG